MFTGLKSGFLASRSLAALGLLLVSTLVARAGWDYVNPPNPYYGANHLVSHEGELYVATNEGVHKTNNSGADWTDLTQGFVTVGGNTNRHLEFHGSNIFVASTRLGAFMSPDDGATWQMDTTGLEDSFNADMMHLDQGQLYISMNWPTYGFYSKEAGSGAWSRVVSGDIGTGFVNQVLGMSRVGNSLFAATRVSGVYVSQDNGVNWELTGNVGYPGELMNRMVTNGQDLFIPTGNGVFRSTDQSENWERVDENFASWGQFGTPIQCLGAEDGAVFAATAQDDSVYVSEDAGDSWTDFSDGDALTHSIKSFCMHDGMLYAAQWDMDTSIVRYDIQLDLSDEGVRPQQLKLHPNHPNPFNPNTTIRYTLPAYGIGSGRKVKLTVSDMAGRQVATLVNGVQATGEHEVLFRSEGLPSGLYIYSLVSEDFREDRKMLLIK